MNQIENRDEFGEEEKDKQNRIQEQSVSERGKMNQRKGYDPQEARVKRQWPWLRLGLGGEREVVRERKGSGLHERVWLKGGKGF